MTFQNVIKNLPFDHGVKSQKILVFNTSATTGQGKFFVRKRYFEELRKKEIILPVFLTSNLLQMTVNALLAPTLL